MATTIPTEFVGEPVLDAERLATLKYWYHLALGDSDKADDELEATEYEVTADVMEHVLRLLHGMPLDDETVLAERKVSE